METNTLGVLIRALKSQSVTTSTTGSSSSSNESKEDEKHRHLEACVHLLEDFNKSNEMKFRFDDVNVDQNEATSTTSMFYACLSSSWAYLTTTVASASMGEDATTLLTPTSATATMLLHARRVAACLNAIRIISRDTRTINMFENERLLELIQIIAHLDFHEDKINVLSNSSISNEKEQEKKSTLTASTVEWKTSLRLHALKCMSNLIYNSKYVQEHYASSGAAEMITIYLKQFTPSEVLNTETATSKLELNVVMFNLRVLFLLTVFNRELRMKLREKLQVITYLIEIIDQVMKERLNGGSAGSGAFVLTTLPLNPETVSLTTDIDESAIGDYCLLKTTDVDFIIEILKILYNLTMDMASHSKLSSQMETLPALSAGNNEEEEAHLMHLVSVLRDLITCRLENSDDTAKLGDLHSNIINLLTNMPSTCYEELLSPLNPTSSISSQQQQQQQQQQHPSDNCSYYLNVRMAHNRKRISRRSKRMKQRQQQQQQPQQEEETLNNDNTASQLDDQSMLTIDDQDVEFEGKNMEAISIILAFMNRHVNTYISASTSSNADALCPVLLLLSLMCKSNKLIRQYCRLKVLPPLKRADLLRLPQQGNQLRNKLVRLMTDAHLQLKRLSAQFLFVLCKESVKRLIKYTGFGNAAGLLAEMGLMANTKVRSNSGNGSGVYSSSGESTADNEGSDTDDYKQLETCINPVTGRAEIGPSHDPFEGMSDEQKEHEAMRLVNDLDRLMRISGGLVRPARVGADGRPVAVEHLLELQQHVNDNVTNKKSNNNNSDKRDQQRDD